MVGNIRGEIPCICMPHVCSSQLLLSVEGYLARVTVRGQGPHNCIEQYRFLAGLQNQKLISDPRFPLGQRREEHTTLISPGTRGGSIPVVIPSDRNTFALPLMKTANLKYSPSPLELLFIPDLKFLNILLDYNPIVSPQNPITTHSVFS